MRIVYKDRDEKKIQAKAGASILSWGEDIDIGFELLGTQKTKIFVTSEASAQLFSWGKNDQNEEDIINEISKRVTRR